MIIKITNVHQEFTKNGAEWMKVAGVDANGKETTKLVFDKHKNKWPLLVEGATLEFKMAKQGQFWNITDILPVETPPPQSSQEVLPKDQKEINRARQEGKETNQPAPQAVGMLTKEIGDMIRADKLIPIFGKETAIELVGWYREQTLGITRIPFDGAKLPQFSKVEKKAKGNEVEPGDIPY